MEKTSLTTISMIRKTTGYTVSFVIIILFLFSCNSGNRKGRSPSKSEVYIQSILADREKLEKQTADTTFSRFNAEEIAQFKIKPRQYFYPDTQYIIKAVFTLDTSTPVFRMPTNTDRKPKFRIYGYLDFTVKDTTCRLTAYQYMETPEDNDFLFIPFGDKTNDYTTYGGGRYLDIPMPASDTVILDFNKAYNPYCSYSDRWSCTLVPPVNMLDVHIFAGEKIYREGHH